MPSVARASVRATISNPGPAGHPRRPIFCTISADGTVPCRRMAALLGERLVLDLDGIGAGTFQQPHGTHHFMRCRSRCRHRLSAGPTSRIAATWSTSSVTRPGRYRARRGSIGDAGAGDVGGREAEVGDHARGECIAHAGKDQRGAGFEQVAELAAGRLGHRHVIAAVAR